MTTDGETLYKIEPRPPHFQTTLVYELMPWLERPRLLVDDLVYDDGVVRITGKAGFRYDGASIPRLTRWLLSPEQMEYAAAFHDLFYWHGYDKDVSDRVMYLIIMAEGKMPRWKARLAWRGVQVLAWPAWLGHWWRRHKEDSNG